MRHPEQGHQDARHKHTQFFRPLNFARKLRVEVVELKPESGFMQKGIERIEFKKQQSVEYGISLQVNVIDTTGQATQVSIDKISEHQIDGKRDAFEQCQELYPDTAKYCQVLRSPSRYDK